MPMDLADYPPDWKEISQRAREAAGDRCVQCGVKNGAVGARDRNGRWHDEDAIHHMNSDVGYALFDSRFPKMTRIVLTVHHEDGDPSNNDPSNLFALCQRDHLARDREKHTRNASETRRRRFLERTGQCAMELA